MPPFTAFTLHRPRVAVPPARCARSVESFSSAAIYRVRDTGVNRLHFLKVYGRVYGRWKGWRGCCDPQAHPSNTRGQRGVDVRANTHLRSHRPTFLLHSLSSQHRTATSHANIHTQCVRDNNVCKNTLWHPCTLTIHWHQRAVCTAVARNDVPCRPSSENPYKHTYACLCEDTNAYRRNTHHIQTYIEHSCFLGSLRPF